MTLTKIVSRQAVVKYPICSILGFSIWFHDMLMMVIMIIRSIQMYMPVHAVEDKVHNRFFHVYFACVRLLRLTSVFCISSIYIINIATYCKIFLITNQILLWQSGQLFHFNFTIILLLKLKYMFHAMFIKDLTSFKML